MQAIFKAPKLAKPCYKIAWQSNIKNPNILAAYGLMLIRNNEALQAKAIYSKIIQTQPNFQGIKTVKANMSICLWKLGDIDAAINEYEEIITEYQEDNFIFERYTLDHIDHYIEHNYILIEQDYTTLGFYYLLKKDYEKCEFFTRASLKLNEQNSAAYDNLGQLNYKLHHFDDAKKYFMQALEINSSLADSHYYLGLTFKEEGNPKKAKLYFEKALKCTITGLNTVSKEDIKKEILELSDL